MVSQRGLEVLRAIVEDYVQSREPVGSKAIVDRHQFGVSAATIRNDMALLEEEQLITAPHTSSGRVPTDKGYRLFVDHLVEIRQINSAQKQAIDKFLDSASDFDELLNRTVRVLSQLTNQVAVVQYPTLGNTRVRRLEIVAVGAQKVLCILITDNGRVEQRLVDLEDHVTEDDLTWLTTMFNDLIAGKLLTDLANLGTTSLDVPSKLQNLARTISQTITESVDANRQQKLVMAGTANLVKTETDFHGSLYPVLDAIEEQVIILKLLSEIKAEIDEISVSIGTEHSNLGLEDASVIATGYSASGESAALGLLGPTRMDYSNNIASIRAVARYLTQILDNR